MTTQAKQKSKRLERERKTVQKMILIYCKSMHHSPKGELCPDCQSLFDYASKRIDRCPFSWRKPTCARCPVHCYKPVFLLKYQALFYRKGEFAEMFAFFFLWKSKP